MPKPILDKLREVFPSAKPFLMYGLTEAFRSTYLDPAEVDRRPDSIGKAIPDAEILWSGLMGRPAIRVKRANSSIADRMWRSGTGTTRCVPQSVSGRFPAATQPWRTPELAVWSGDAVIADERGLPLLRRA